MDATHVHCPRCNSIQPMIWNWTKIVVPAIHSTFEGGVVMCRTCRFEITKIGNLRIPPTTE